MIENPKTTGNGSEIHVLRLTLSQISLFDRHVQIRDLYLSASQIELLFCVTEFLEHTLAHDTESLSFR